MYTRAYLSVACKATLRLISEIHLLGLSMTLGNYGAKLHRVCYGLKSNFFLWLNYL